MVQQSQAHKSAISKGVKVYHSCCSNAKCGKKHQAKAKAKAPKKALKKAKAPTKRDVEKMEKMRAKYKKEFGADAFYKQQSKIIGRAKAQRTRQAKAKAKK